MKKITALFLAVFMVFGMTACRSDRNKPVNGNTKPATQAKTEITSSESTTKAETVTATTTSAPTTGATTVVTTGATTAAEKEKSITSANRNVRDIEQFRGKKLLAITFDDGPYTPVTMSILNRLDKYNARVTFFVLGSRLDSNKSYRETMKKAYEMGNQIGSHTYSHKDLTSLSDKELEKEIDKTKKSVKDVLGIEPDAIRPPYGSTSAKVETAMNKHIILWSIDPMDWKYKNADTVCNNIVNNAFDGGIVLLHDLYQTSADGAIKAIEKLTECGYAFVTVDELAQLRGVDMDTSTKYFSFKPHI